MNTFIILAGGQSTRFDGDKLLERFAGLTLPQQAVAFALANGAERICVTLSHKQIHTDGRTIKHEVLDDLLKIHPVEVTLQDPKRYGAGAALGAWQQHGIGAATVLFGDNYYKGILPIMADGNALYYSTVTRQQPSARNLQLAAVKEGVVIEKPHTIVSGEYFAGFIKMPATTWQMLPGLRSSDRNEYDIVDIINGSPHTKRVRLEDCDIVWDDVTFASDIKRVSEMISCANM
jgi:dTDP-glucose pyrophosphorylase